MKTEFNVVSVCNNVSSCDECYADRSKCRCAEPQWLKADQILNRAQLHQADAPVDEKNWEFVVENGECTVICWNDCGTAYSSIKLQRTGWDVQLMTDVK